MVAIVITHLFNGYYCCHWLPTGDSAVVHISKGLKYNSGLELLLLADNPFGDDGGLSLAEVLCKENVTLRVLDIHGTRMSQRTEQKVLTTSHYLT